MKFTTYLQKTLENWSFWETRFRDRVPESRAGTHIFVILIRGANQL